MYNMLPLSVTILITSSFILSHGHDTRLQDANGNYFDLGCGTEEYNERLLANDASWQQSLTEFETEWATRSAAIQSGQSVPAEFAESSESSELGGFRPSSEFRASGRTITIPVVFHVVAQNPWSIPDNALSYQISRLNTDYSATNRDYTSGTPSEFRNVLSGDTGIRFVWYRRINRQTWVSQFDGDSDDIKFCSRGGSNVVSPDRYLNIWVGPLSRGLLGQAQFPGGPWQTDGVELDPSTLAPFFGNAPYNLGRAAVHEVGHWLFLRHIWGDDATCYNTPDRPDYVMDTPPSSALNRGCPAGIKRCSNNPYTQDMYMNHMDYTVDSCRVMFTRLQIERAWYSIYTFRSGFNPSRLNLAQKPFVNGLYFTRFEGGEEEAKCYGDDVLFYENDLNEESASDIKIYGCLMKTTNMNIGHITDIKFVYAAKKGDGEDDDEGDAESKCDDGYTQATQDLNEGNDGDSIYLCYKQEDSTPGVDDMAILDITVIKDDDVSKLDMNEWEMNEQDNINPNGVKLNFAFKRGTYYVDDDMISGDEQEAICNVLRADDCSNEVDEEGDHLCGYNEETGVCYAVVRRAGINGDGNYDDGFIDAQNAGKAESDQIYLIVFVFCGVIVLLLICMVCGGCYLYQKSKQSAMKHDHQAVQWMETAIAMGQIMNVQRLNQVQETKGCQE